MPDKKIEEEITNELGSNESMDISGSDVGDILSALKSENAVKESILKMQRLILELKFPCYLKNFQDLRG